jgi:two-component system sensor histidine kinase BaeS
MDPHDPVSLVWLMVATLIAVLTAALLSVTIARRLIRPVEGYIDTARRFAEGDHSARPADLGPPEFHALAEALVAAADEIERSERARQQLTADIAHELRTPLTALQAGLEELRDGLVPAEPATLAALHDQASRLGRIVGDLSALAAAESDGLELHLEPIDLGEVVRLAGSAWEVPLRSTGVSVEHDVPSGVVVLADRDRVQQILGNLLANAAAYCRSGDTVCVLVSTEGSEGLLRVADTGPGFRAEDLPIVFERSWRGASAAGTQGAGLGLPIVRALAEAQGGSVQVQSEEGRGATITVRLPTATAPRSG